MLALTLCGLASCALYLALLGVDAWGRECTRFLALYGGAAVLYGLAAWRVLRGPGLGPRGWILVLGTGALARAILLVAEPTLSDDLYRYLWDGRVLLSGVNPYRHAPVAPELEPLRDALWPLINNPSLPTIYPPLLQVVFGAVAAIAPTVFAMKAAMGLFDLAAGVLLWLALGRMGRRREHALLYLWNPLLIVEFAGQGHADAVGLFLVAAAILAWSTRRAMTAGVALTLAGLVKFLPWAAVPWFLPRLRLRWALLPLLVAAAYAAFATGGVDPLGSLSVYAAKWRSNDFLFALLHRDGPDPEAALASAKSAAAVLVVAVWLTVTLLRRPWVSVYAWTIGAVLLLSPVVHPWYVAWLLPAAVVLPHPAWWVWSVLAPLAYHPLPRFLAGGPWEENWAFKVIEYAPVLLLLAAQIVLEARRARRGPGSGMLAG